MGYSLSSQIEFVEATIEYERGSGIESMYREIHESLTFRLREIEAAVDTPIPDPVPDRADVEDVTQLNDISIDLRESTPWAYSGANISLPKAWYAEVTGAGYEVEACTFDAPGLRKLAAVLNAMAAELDRRNA